MLSASCTAKPSASQRQCARSGGSRRRPRRPAPTARRSLMDARGVRPIVRAVGGGGSPRGSANVKRAPPSARLRAFDRAAVRLDDRAADRQPEADAGRRAFLAAALELAGRSPPRGPRGRPGPWSSTQTSTLSLDRAPRRSSIGVPGGVYLAAFSSRLASTRSISTASMCTSGRSAGSATRTVRPLERRAERLQRAADHLFERLPLAVRAAPRRPRAAPCRAGC